MHGTPSRGWLVAALNLGLIAAGIIGVRAKDATPTPVSAPGATIVGAFTLPTVSLATALNPVLGAHPIADDRGIPLGGVGSDLWHGAGDAPDEFWMITDRGPNQDIEVKGDDLLTFPVPDFTPVILHVRAENGGLSILETIPLVDGGGTPVTGLPNLKKHDPTPYGIMGTEKLAPNPDGLDTEGLVRTADGGFWVVDEYGPSLARVSAAGVVEARYTPKGQTPPGATYPVHDTLPAIFAERRVNRGFEGLAISPDGGTLFLLLQSPLANPDEDTSKKSLTGRILAVNAATGEPTAEYAYPFDAAKSFDPTGDTKQGDLKLSAVVALNADTLLVEERTDAVAKVYLVELSGATNLLGSAWDDPKTAPSLEETNDLAAAGVTPLAKSPVLDLSTLPGMPEKIEGVAVLGPNLIAVANDNDFSVSGLDDAGEFTGDPTPNTVLVIQLDHSLPVAVDQGATPVAVN